MLFRSQLRMRRLISLCTMLVVALAACFASAPSPPVLPGNGFNTAIGTTNNAPDVASNDLKSGSATRPAIQTADFLPPDDVGWQGASVSNCSDDETGMASALTSQTGLKNPIRHTRYNHGSGGPALSAMLSSSSTTTTTTTIRETRDGHTGMPVLAWNVNCSNRQTATTPAMLQRTG